MGTVQLKPYIAWPPFDHIPSIKKESFLETIAIQVFRQNSEKK